MSLVSAQQLSFARSQVLETLPDVGTILTLTNTSDGQGGFSQAWSGTVPVDCRLDVLNVREQAAGGGYNYFQKTILTLPYNASITTSSRFAYESDIYNVKGVYGTNRSWNVSVRCELEKV